MLLCLRPFNQTHTSYGVISLSCMYLLSSLPLPFLSPRLNFSVATTWERPSTVSERPPSFLAALNSSSTPHSLEPWACSYLSPLVRWAGSLGGVDNQLCWWAGSVMSSSRPRQSFPLKNGRPSETRWNFIPNTVYSYTCGLFCLHLCVGACVRVVTASVSYAHGYMCGLLCLPLCMCVCMSVRVCVWLMLQFPSLLICLLILVPILPSLPPSPSSLLRILISSNIWRCT